MYVLFSDSIVVSFQPPPEAIKRISSRKPVKKKRQGGSGVYQVIQCGTAGHNVRSKPSMKGTPVGRLTKGNKIEALEEVSELSHFPVYSAV